ncbi:MAG: DUF3048 domain-containing protein [Candidatus Paceibacterota bacterium]
MKFNLNKILILIGSIALIFVVSFFVWWNNEIIITKDGIKVDSRGAGLKSSISGIECENASRRPVAVILAGDPETMPLSGIGQADLVFEMPVTPNITRLMAVFQCEEPGEIGSIRSAREDFIPLAAGLGSIFAHWGGEKDALARLDSGVIDNIDALKYEGTVFYRKNSLPRPHNGFTTIDLLLNKANSLDYEIADTFSGYPHSDNNAKRNLSNLVSTININYPGQYKVQWQYDESTNLYSRFRGNLKEKDRNSSKPIVAGVVIVMKTSSRILNKDYISVSVAGEGDVLVYQNGSTITGKWKKDPARLDSKLYFYDNNGQEIKFLPGKIWIEIITN